MITLTYQFYLLIQSPSYQQCSTAPFLRTLSFRRFSSCSQWWMCFRSSKKANKKMEKEIKKSAEEPKPARARSPPRSADQRKDLSRKNEQLPPFQSPPPLVSDPNYARISEVKRKSGKKHGKKDGEDSDNTLTDLPHEMPEMELERFDLRQQLILDHQLL
ncbi:hypothetical protein COOONC_15341 [Cooperia oncophora]